MRFLQKIWRSFWGVPLACAAFAAAPLALTLAAGMFGYFLGCDINEAGTDPCLRFGLPFGKLLYPFAVAGWFSAFTVPIGAVVAFAWAVRKAILYFACKR